MNPSFFSPVGSPFSSFSMESSLDYSEDLNPLSPLSHYTESASSFTYASLGDMAEQLCSSNPDLYSTPETTSTPPPFEDLVNDFYASSDEERLLTPRFAWPTGPSPCSAPCDPIELSAAAELPIRVKSPYSSSKTSGTISLAVLESKSHQLDEGSFEQSGGLWGEQPRISLNDHEVDLTRSPLLSYATCPAPSVTYSTPIRAPHRTKSNPALQANKQGRYRLPAKASLPALREESLFASQFVDVFDGGAVLGSQPSMFAVLGGYGGEEESLGRQWDGRTLAMDAYGSDYSPYFDTSSFGSIYPPSFSSYAPNSTAFSPPHISDLPPVSNKEPTLVKLEPLPDREAFLPEETKASPTETCQLEDSAPLMICGWQDPGSVSSLLGFPASSWRPQEPVASSSKLAFSPYHPTATGTSLSARLVSLPIASTFVEPPPSPPTCASPVRLQKPITLRTVPSKRVLQAPSPRPTLTRKAGGAIKYSFINYTVNDADTLMTGVAPSGNTKKVVPAAAVTPNGGGREKRKREVDEENEERSGKRRA